MSACECSALDAAMRGLGDREIAVLAGQLTKVAAHIAARVGSARGLPPPGTLPGAGADRIDLSAQPTAVPVTAMFVRNTLFKWQWGDVLVDAERAVREMTNCFVAALDACDLGYPTRMSVRLRAVSAGRLIVELHDSVENAAAIAGSGNLISKYVERISARCGQYRTGGRTVLWAELGRPELASRWI
ncbi:hypothetical protein [Nocardia mexicana]|uniref:hypothetical protein n=1 Tax=Nocardia mexicana TaxID=279262 RepID=UPI0011C04795|nr:hypothetical protein [Nocardia mexicana]